MKKLKKEVDDICEARRLRAEGDLWEAHNVHINLRKTILRQGYGTQAEVDASIENHRQRTIDFIKDWNAGKRYPIFREFYEPPMPKDLQPRSLDLETLEMIRGYALEALQVGSQNELNLIHKYIELYEYLSKPENHIKVRTGQYVEKKVYTRNESDMKAEMVKELVNLPRFTAWVKRIYESNTTVKNKTKIYSVDEIFKYNSNYREILQKIIQETHERYCTRRDLIEEEIIKRQAR